MVNGCLILVMETSLGPLSGLRIIEFAAKGPAPLCGMLLGDMGADVIRIERPAQGGDLEKTEASFSILHRNRRSIGLDLRRGEGRDATLRLLETADGLLEGFRPGVMERLALGPDACLALNPRLVYGRVTGWGREGPLAERAGHDINYLALTGALHAIGSRGGAPVPPLNLLADYGGGAMFLAFGVVCALLEARSSGRGQVVDVAMTDSVATLMTAIHGLHNAGQWQTRRGSNLLDSGAPFYATYETKDGQHLAVGPIERQFFAQLLERLDIPASDMPQRLDARHWTAHGEVLRAAFLRRTRAEWEAVFDGSDACVTPVLSIAEAPKHPHNLARNTYVSFGGAMQAAPAPRLSRTPGSLRRLPPEPGADGIEILREAGLSEGEINHLSVRGAFVPPPSPTSTTRSNR